MVLRKYIESIVLTKVFAVYCSILLNVLHNGTTYLYWWTSCIQEPINIIIFLTTVHFNISIYNNQSHLKAYHAYFYKKNMLWMKTIHYLNKIRSHLVTIVPMAPFTPKSALKLRSALHLRYSSHPTLHSPR